MSTTRDQTVAAGHSLEVDPHRWQPCLDELLGRIAGRFGRVGYSPLRSRLAVTPFALGVAVSAALAGRLVARVGRWLTVSGLTITVIGLAATALVLRQVTGDRAA